MNIQKALDELDTPPMVELNYIESAQQVEVVIEGINGKLIMVEDIDPLVEQLSDHVPEALFE